MQIPGGGGGGFITKRGSGPKQLSRKIYFGPVKAVPAAAGRMEKCSTSTSFMYANEFITADVL